MKTCLLFLAIFISHTLCAQSSWKPLGGNGGLVSDAASARSTEPSIATDSAGTPYIAYRDISSNNALVVKKFDGANWIAVVDSGTHHRCVNSYIQISSKDTIYIAFQDVDNSAMIDSTKFTVIKYDGTDWVQVGNSIMEADYFYELSLAIDSNEKIYLGYAATSNQPGKANIRTYDGTDWVPVGNTDFVQYSGEMNLCIDANNNLYVGYDSYAGNIAIVHNDGAWIQKWNGTQWDTVGNTGFPSLISIDIAANGTIFALQGAAPANGDWYEVKKFQNNIWTSLGAPGCTELKVNKAGIPHLIGGSWVLKYNGVNWVGYGDTLVTQTNYILDSKLAFGKNNTPYVTGRNGSSQNEKIFAFYYDSVVTSIKELKNKQQITVYPNPVPTTDLSFFIEAQNLGTAWYDLTLFNSIGQLVFTDKVYHEQGTSIFIHPKATLQTGKYYIRLSGKRKDVVASLMVQ